MADGWELITMLYPHLAQPSVQEVGQFGGDLLRQLRFNNQIGTYKKCLDKIKAMGLDGNVKPSPSLFPLLAHPSYAHALSQLSPLDAQILHRLYAEWCTDHDATLDTTQTAKEMDIDREIVVISFNSLDRAGVCKDATLGQRSHTGGIFADLMLTAYGVSFMRACKREF